VRVKGHVLNLLWGQVGSNVSSLELRFQDGSTRTLPLSRGVFLYPFPPSRWLNGHRPAFLIPRNAKGRALAKRLLLEYTLAR